MYAGSSAGYADGYLTNAKFSGLRGVAVKSDNALFVVDSGNYLIRAISSNGGCLTLSTFLFPTNCFVCVSVMV